MKEHRFAFFDADCRELSDAGDGLQFRPRVRPMADTLGRLYDWADEHQSPLVFTTCCSGRMLSPTGLPGIVFVPTDAASGGWRSSIGAQRRFYLQKLAYGDPKVNFACRAYDMFQDNANAVPLVQALDAEQWVVFGNGFDLCVNSAARGLLDAGQRVCLLADLTVPSATGYGRCGTPEDREAIINELAARGVTITSLDEWLVSVS